LTNMQILERLSIKASKAPTSPIPSKSGMTNQATPNQKERNLYPVKFMTMKSEVYPVGSEDRTGAHLTGVQSEMPLAEKTIGDVLLQFDQTKKTARRRYREFVEKGIKQGTREDLQGGGLVRSAGGETAGLLGRKAEEREKGDARILGSGDFVDSTLHQSEKLLEGKYRPKKSIDELIKVVAEEVGVSPELICSGSRKQRISNARSIVAHMAIEEIGHSATDVARHLGIRQTSVLQSVIKGKILCGRIDLQG